MTDSDMLRHFAPKAVKEVKNKVDYGAVKDDLKDYVCDMCDILGRHEIYEWLASTSFFDMPASHNQHGSFPTALAQHSVLVAYNLLRFTVSNRLSWKNQESPLLVGLLHDACKIDGYVINGDGEHCVAAFGCGNRTVKAYSGGWNISYNNGQLFPGHGERSVLKLLSAGIRLTDEEIACIRYHMGAFTDKSEWEYYKAAAKKFPNVLWTHQADIVTSYIYNI